MIEWMACCFVTAAALELTFTRGEPDLGGLVMQAAGRRMGELHMQAYLKAVS